MEIRNLTTTGLGFFLVLHPYPRKFPTTKITQLTAWDAFMTYGPNYTWDLSLV